MKKIFGFLIILAILTTILLSGCRPAEPVSEPEEETLDQSLEELEELDQLEGELALDFSELDNLELK